MTGTSSCQPPEVLLACDSYAKENISVRIVFPAHLAVLCATSLALSEIHLCLCHHFTGRYQSFFIIITIIKSTKWTHQRAIFWFFAIMDQLFVIFRIKPHVWVEINIIEPKKPMKKLKVYSNARKCQKRIFLIQCWLNPSSNHENAISQSYNNIKGIYDSKRTVSPPLYSCYYLNIICLNTILFMQACPKINPNSNPTTDQISTDHTTKLWWQTCFINKNGYIYYQF